MLWPVLKGKWGKNIKKMQKMGRFSQFGGARNGTSGAKIKILRSPAPPNKPPKPPKSHLRSPNRTSKSDFLPFCVFLIFSPRFPLSTGHNIKSQIYKGRRPQIKKCQKQTHFKIQFYIGVHVTRSIEWFCFIHRALVHTSACSCSFVVLGWVQIPNAMRES